MNNRLVQGSRTAALAGVAIFGIGLACSAAGLRINTTRSIPLGIYWARPGPLQKGSYVFFCPPDVALMVQARQRGYLDTGPCPGGYGYMMKRVAASAGDVVSVTERGVRVNDAWLRVSAPLPQDRSGREMPRLQPSHFIVGASEVVLMSDVSATSFDSRYYGPIDRAQIKNVVVPVLTW